MAVKNISERDKQELESFGRMAAGMETRRKELLAEAHRRAELELYQYRMTVLTKLEELLKRHSASQIVRNTGLARSTVYRWMARLRQERMMAEAAAKGITIEAAGGMGGFVKAISTEASAESGDRPIDVPTELKPRTHSEMGWSNGKKLVSGEIGALDAKGNSWVFDPETDEAWNKTENVNIEGRENWPEGAEDLVDSLTQ